MSRAGALYLDASRQSGVTRAVLAGHPRDSASQLAAARLLRLGGTAGRVPAGYFADAPAADLPDRSEGGVSRHSSRSFSR